MAIAQRYVNKELFGLFLLIMGFLLLVVVGGRFLGYLEEASLGSLSGMLAAVSYTHLTLPTIYSV